MRTPCKTAITAVTPRIFGLDPPSRGTVLPAFGHENGPSSVRGGPLLNIDMSSKQRIVLPAIHAALLTERTDW